MPVSAVILAAGLGTRFNSSTAKVLHKLLGKELVLYPLELALGLDFSPLVVVVGYQAEAVKAVCARPGVSFAYQAEQKGTGHAVACATGALAGFEGDVLILSGDVPLLKAETLTAFIQGHQEAGAVLSFMAARVDDPTGYGRVKRLPGEPERYEIVEDKDASEAERRIEEINAGLYLVRAGFLFEAIKRLSPENAQGEYYLPDIIRLAGRDGLACRPFWVEDVFEVMGVNDRAQLALAEERLRVQRASQAV